MTIKKFVTIVIISVGTVALLFILFRPLCLENGNCNYIQLFCYIGVPFGIRKMFLWIVPKGFDIGGTIGVLTLNFIVGEIIGSVILIWKLVLAAIYLGISVGNPPCMGGLHGRSGGDPSSDMDERNLSETERNHRTSLCRRKRKTWNEIYTVQRIGKSDNGADPFICMYESKETGNLEMEKGWAKESLLFCLQSEAPRPGSSIDELHKIVYIKTKKL